MLKSKLGVSIVESIMVVFILSFAIYGLFSIYTGSSNLSSSTQKKVEALAIAREGIEAMQNIRDTNWNAFSSDYPNCWNSMNYNLSCVKLLTNLDRHKIPRGDYIITKDDNTDKWVLTNTGAAITDFKTSAYRDAFRVYKNSEGFYSQWHADYLNVAKLNTDFPTPQTPRVAIPKPTTSPTFLYTRRINITYCSDFNKANCNLGLSGTVNRDIMLVTSIVEWQDPSSSEPSKIELQTFLTNYITKY